MSVKKQYIMQLYVLMRQPSLFSHNQMMHFVYALLLSVGLVFSLTGQNTVRVELQWHAQPDLIFPTPESAGAYYLGFEGAEQVFVNGLAVPMWSARLALPDNIQAQPVLSNLSWQPMALPVYDASALPAFEVSSHVGCQGAVCYGFVSLIPLRVRAGIVEQLTAFDIEWQKSDKPAFQKGGPTNTFVSVLAEGTIYKLGVVESGIHRLDYNFLSSMGIAVQGLPSNNIHIYGNGGRMLPELAGAPYPDDIYRIAIAVEDGGDGQMNPGDFVLFYAQGPAALHYDAANDVFSRPLNIYSDTAYYFLKIAPELPKRVPVVDLADPVSPPVTEVDFFVRHELDATNILAANTKSVTQGSGKKWFGDYFGETVRTRSYVLPTPNRTGAPLVMHAEFAGMSVAPSQVVVRALGQQKEMAIGSSNPFSSTSSVARLVKMYGWVFDGAPGNELSFEIEYPSNGNANEGWLDYIQFVGRRQLVFNGTQMLVFDRASAGQPLTKFALSGGNSSLRVWDVTNHLEPVQLPLKAAGTMHTWVGETNTPLSFFQVFNPAQTLTPVALGTVPNQNLHGVEMADMLIVYPPQFHEAAAKLAAHRQAHNGFKVVLATTQQVFNEFSSGMHDPGAIRNLAKLLYQRDPLFRYLLLLGDGSFDARSRMVPFSDNTAFVPLMQTAESLDGITSYPWDDFFGLLSDNEGVNPIHGLLEVAVGRVVAGSPLQAMQMVDKIIRYEASPMRWGNWRNRLTFVGDDDELNVHSIQSNEQSVRSAQQHPVYNHNKIFIDAYPKEAGAGGQRVPGASDAINKDMFDGVLAMIYFGHGGPHGWAQERILREEFIDSWSNADAMPVLITATCTFAGFDNPLNLSAGEKCLLNPLGGASALLTTVRAVYSGFNVTLTQNVLDTLFDKSVEGVVRLGDALVAAKNAMGPGDNKRRFCLLGDPAMQMAVPQFEVVTTEINGRPVSGLNDTIRALQKVTISGFIADMAGNLKSDFNGVIYPSVFDKPVSLTTLRQNTPNAVNYTLQRNVLFNGAASVINGQFTFSFVVPLDINYQFGSGKISYYATNQRTDAHGYHFLTIGGTDESAPQDDTPPVVELFINNWDFRSGDKSDNTPLLLARLKDDNGINVSGIAIGHDLTAILKGPLERRYVLNSFYKSDLNNYSSGTVRYPIEKLPEGRYEVTVRAWDIANNIGQGTTTFVVAPDVELAIFNLLSYPNPLMSGEAQFMFSHNFGAEALNVQVDIFDMVGRPVRTLSGNVTTDGGQVVGAQWDGTDGLGGSLPQGVYLYRVRVKKNSASDGLYSEIEQLVLMK